MKKSPEGYHKNEKQGNYEMAQIDNMEETPSESMNIDMPLPSCTVKALRERSLLII